MLLHKFTDMMTSASVERTTVVRWALALVWGKLTSSQTKSLGSCDVTDVTDHNSSHIADMQDVDRVSIQSKLLHPSLAP